MNTERFADPDGRWAMAVPTEWAPQVAGNDLGGVDVAFLLTAPADPARWMDDPNVDSLAVMVTPGATAEMAEDVWLSMIGDNSAAAAATLPTQLAGRPARELVMDGPNGDVIARVHWVFLFVDGAIYLIVHTAPAQRYDGEEPLVSAALATFEVLGPSVAAPPSTQVASFTDVVSPDEGQSAAVRQLLAFAEGSGPGGSSSTKQRRQALGELLSLVGDEDVASGVASNLANPDDARALLPQLHAAVQRCVERAEGGVVEPFDILDDAALLICRMVSVDDSGAAAAARQVIAATRRIAAATGTEPTDFDPLFTLATQDSAGIEFQGVLTELTAGPDAEVRLAARESLAAARAAGSAVEAPREKKSRFKWLTG